MNSKRITQATILILGISFVLQHNAFAQTRLGLFFTQEELQVWKKRMDKGPYKTAEDVSKNSPGDWTRILSNATAFLSDPSIGRWNGKTGSCFNNNDTNIDPSWGQGRHIKDAGFAWLLTQNTEYLNAVRKELLTQAGLAGTDWTSTTVWSGNCLKVVSGNLTQLHNPTLEVHAWLRKMLYAYDFIRNDISIGDRTTLDTWFSHAAYRFKHLNDHYLEQRWPKRDTDDYASSPWSQGSGKLMYFGGPNRYAWHEVWNNNVTLEVTFQGLVGIMTNDSTLKDSAKRFFKEVIRYNVWSDGMLGDMHRWHDSGNVPCKGFWYTGDQLSDLIALADAFARSGDFELYNYTTSEGFAGSEGGPKSLRTAIQHYQGLVDHTIVKYTTDKSSQYIIDSDCSDYPGTNWVGVEDIVTAMANNFYRDANIKQGYMRNGSGTPPYPANPNSTGNCGTSWEGTWCTLPGVLFMFGQMEDQVWPYPESGTNPVPSQPNPQGV